MKAVKLEEPLARKGKLTHTNTDPLWSANKMYRWLALLQHLLLCIQYDNLELELCAQKGHRKQGLSSEYC